ncbi:MAG: hypothetical protein JW987_15980 [Anaerolineaceae bacterium]|nr:hypothetical protein [Anaerolineaceae bacterium]
MEKIRWAPKVRQVKIRQLYENDAAGMVDEELLQEVGYALLDRCQSIWLVTRREVECPRCGTVFSLGEEGEGWKMRSGVQTCPKEGCGWQTSAEEWHNTWAKKDLLGMAARDALAIYLRDFPRAKTAQERMVCIDQLIHAFHISLRDGQLNRSFANNLIEGSHQQVVEFLDGLSALPGGVDKTEWRDHVKTMFKRRKGKA